MRTYERENPLLSACGLNCGLCPRFYTEGSSRCAGCGGKHADGAFFFETRPTCSVVTCNKKRDISFCFLCDDFPCEKLEKAECFDSFITHRNMLTDLAKAKEIGITAYTAALQEKMQILQLLLTDYNDGRKKSFYCNIVNLLPLEDLKSIMAKLVAETKNANLPVKEKATLATSLLQNKADALSIDIALRKK